MDTRLIRASKITIELTKFLLRATTDNYTKDGGAEVA